MGTVNQILARAGLQSVSGFSSVAILGTTEPENVLFLAVLSASGTLIWYGFVAWCQICCVERMNYVWLPRSTQKTSKGTVADALSCT